MALIGALVVVAMLGVRPITSEDLGCHLAYGKAFWQEGRIVDYNDFLYTLPSADVPPDQRPEPMAGGWYDQQGRCRFPNANWLTQVIFGGVYLLGGFTGLNVLLMLMVWVFFALTVVLMQRLGVGPLGIAFGLILIGLIAFLRFTLRPELLGYLALLGQAALLAPLMLALTTARIRVPRIIALVALQWVLANVHSYFYIGLGLTGAVALDGVARWAWAAFVEKKEAPDVLRHNARWLAVLLAAQVAACFVNPWTWRLVFLPLQTISYLGQQDVASGAGASPWALLSETQRTFLNSVQFTHAWSDFLQRGFRGDWLRSTYIVVLFVAGIGGLMALLRRRWSQVLWLAAGMYLSLSMVRNVAIGTLLMLPIALAAWRVGLSGMGEYVTEKTRQVLTVLAATAVTAACGLLGVWIATGRIYQPQFQLRFGLGVSRVMVPFGPAKWLNEHTPKGRIWTDFISSSNLFILLDPPRELPIITNGWAYPPAVMEEVIDVYRDTKDLHGLEVKAIDSLNAAADTYGMTTLLVRTDRGMPVWSQLRDRADWSLVFLDGTYAILVRTTGPDADLAREARIEPEQWDAEAYIAHAKEVEFWPAYALEAVGASISSWHWDDQAIHILQEAVDLDPQGAVAWRSLGLALASRGLRRNQQRLPGVKEDFEAAIQALKRSFSIQPDPKVQEKIQAVNALLLRVQRRLPRAPIP
ncbi:MAG: hypothetical protein ACYTFO_04195 [Planctomycetota bacterium]